MCHRDSGESSWWKRSVQTTILKLSFPDRHDLSQTNAGEYQSGEAHMVKKIILIAMFGGFISTTFRRAPKQKINRI